MVNVNNEKANPDVLFQQIADYVCDTTIQSELAFETAQYCLMDTLGCGILALNYNECTTLLGPWFEGSTFSKGARVPGTSFELDPIKAAFDIGAMVRWLDYNDTWLAKEWGHPSDNLGALMAIMDYSNRQGKNRFTVKDLLAAMIKAHEIQGCLALNNSFNAVGLDHVVLVKVASTALATHLMGGDKGQVIDALSHAWLDGQSLRCYRHAPNTGSRKSWAAGDATSRAVRLAQIVLKGESGYPSALSVPRWGFEDVLFKGEKLTCPELSSYVMEHVLFKISYPAEFHGQTAVECALKLHHQISDLDDIQSIELYTQESGFNIINKEGALHNPADRDHCLQYMVAVALLEGKLTADSYTDKTASNPAIDALREKMKVFEDKQYTVDYLDPSKRSIANKIIVRTHEQSFEEEIHYPVGHKNRRQEGIPLLLSKFEHNLRQHYQPEKADELFKLCQDDRLLEMKVDDFVSEWTQE